MKQCNSPFRSVSARCSLRVGFRRRVRLCPRLEALRCCDAGDSSTHRHRIRIWSWLRPRMMYVIELRIESDCSKRLRWRQERRIMARGGTRETRNLAHAYNVHVMLYSGHEGWACLTATCGQLPITCQCPRVTKRNVVLTVVHVRQHQSQINRRSTSKGNQPATLLSIRMLLNIPLGRCRV